MLVVFFGSYQHRVVFEVHVQEELELDMTLSQVCGDYGDALIIRLDEAVVVEARPSQQGDIKLESDECAERFLSAQHNVPHPRLAVIEPSEVPNDHLIRIGNEVAHERELLQKLGTEKNGDRTEKDGQNNEKSQHDTLDVLLIRLIADEQHIVSQK